MKKVMKVNLSENKAVQEMKAVVPIITPRQICAVPY